MLFSNRLEPSVPKLDSRSGNYENRAERRTVFVIALVAVVHFSRFVSRVQCRTYVQDRLFNDPR